MQGIKEALFLDALRGENKGRAPVWFMRQAGRFLPSYQKYREKHSLLELFVTPKLAAEITMLPVDELGVDAAILFSDIAIIALALGLTLTFCEGPKVAPFVTAENIGSLKQEIGRLDPIFEAASLVSAEAGVPLIGFCGGPFTVASYFVEGGEEGIKRLVYREPDFLKALLDRITEITILYLKGQRRAGAAAYQIFDSWAHLLSKEHFLTFCLPYYEKILREVEGPAILFAKYLHLHLEELLPLSCCLSLDASASLPKIRKQTTQCLQGNLDPDLLFAPMEVIEAAGKNLAQSMRGDPAFIAGLGHGVKPKTPVAAVKRLIEMLQEE